MLPSRHCLPTIVDSLNTDRLLAIVFIIPVYTMRTKERFYNQTSGHRCRAKNDVQFAFAYYHYVIENDVIKSTIHEGKKFGAYVPASNFKNALKDYLKPGFLFPFSQKYLWLCMQAGTTEQEPSYQKVRNQGIGSDLIYSVCF